MKLSIIIPFYNESRNIPLVLEAFAEFSNLYEFELICVNDGSKDDTLSIFECILPKEKYGFAKLISYQPNRGYGHAIMTGLKEARGDMVAWTHSDMQTSAADVFRAHDVYAGHSSEKLVVKGWRINRALSQIIFSFGMAVVASLILRRKFAEINAQPKLFPRGLISLMKNPPKDFSLDLYLLCVAQNNGYEIETINVYFPNRIYGESKWAFSWKSKLKTIWRSIKYIWALRNNANS
ncbi:MAG: glycosyltransferase family 2 protein [Candidatus Liptonbacteria bacterium]|nr:glycosyltransferase family 2 protein [Candidatus Liptonbacteria bacterium]